MIILNIFINNYEKYYILTNLEKIIDYGNNL